MGGTHSTDQRYDKCRGTFGPGKRREANTWRRHVGGRKIQKLMLRNVNVDWVCGSGSSGHGSAPSGTVQGD